MPKIDWSADHHGVRHWFSRRHGHHRRHRVQAGARQRQQEYTSVVTVRKPAVTFAILVPVLLAVGAVALVISAGSTTRAKRFTAAAASSQADLAAAPVDGTGDAISLNQTAAQAAASMNCTLAVPANPLSAHGLATPYQLGDGCSESTTDLQAFVETTILSPSGQLQVYNPLVITQGTQPAAAPVVPQIRAGSQVIINVGFNGTNLVLTGPGAAQGNCVDALGQSVIGQVSACNAISFFQLANAEIAHGTLKVAALGTGKDGQPCLDTRNYAVVDQDPSDNVDTTYLLNGKGRTAQNTAANAHAIAGATTIANGSDNALLTKFLDKALGCTPFMAPSVSTAGGTAASQTLDELSAMVNQVASIGLVPTNDEMVLVNSQFRVGKTNVYRSLVDQPLLAANANTFQVAATFCQDMVNIAPARDQLDMSREVGVASPDPANGDNLATFMGNRLRMSFINLKCQDFGLTNPVSVTFNGKGVAAAVAYKTTQQVAHPECNDEGVCHADRDRDALRHEGGK
jgi:hypothetical protein